MDATAINTKACARCGEVKPFSEFHKNPRNRDGLHSYCKVCNKAGAAAHLKTEKGKASLKRALNKAADAGYFRYGKGGISILRQGAEKRSIDFNLTAESLKDWWHSHPDVCCYCGITVDEYLEIRTFIIAYTGANFEISKFKRFYRSPKHQSIRWMTIDRVDNSVGYDTSNMVKSCWICNSLKSDFFDGAQMKTIAPQIISRLKDEIEKERV